MSRTNLLRIAAPAAVLLATAATAHADPAGKTTLQETLAPASPSGYSELQAARGSTTWCVAVDPHRRAPSEPPGDGR
jgi:hypothetical protein